MPPLYDAHLHFQFDSLVPHHATVVADLIRTGVQAVVVNATNEEEFPVVAALCARLSVPTPRPTPGAPLSALNSQLPLPLTLLPSYGIHPWDCGQRSPHWLRHLRAALVADPRTGVGEIGLDRWIIDGVRPDDPRIAGLRVAPLAEQTEVFAAQLDLAAELNRPASIHATQAHGAALDVLRAAPRLPACGFLMHGYGGPAELIKPFADLGAYFSFNVEWLAPCHATRLENFRLIPVDRLLVETDAPVKAPAPDRNRFPLGETPDGTPINHPANLVVAYEALAKLRNLPLDSLAAQVATNFTHLFGPLSPH
ncbi:MAG: hydrolase TatD [Opitutia bacterium]|nr:TatD family deoxyribonuclease [Opitutaceae bacterium]PHX71249.1 MAG: hydrolase TatD [Opitutae bacterium]